MAAPTRSDEPLLDVAVGRLVLALHPERIYLFGSRARGDACKDSDYDFLVVVPDDPATDRRQLERRAGTALDGLGVSKDVMVRSVAEFRRFRPVAGSLVATVEREGRLLFGEPDRFEQALTPMELDERRAELLRDWLGRAEQDLLAAERSAEPPPLVNAVAFHAQHAAEKALKGFLAWHDRPLRKTHELQPLVRECARLSPDFASLLAAARTLTPYAVAGRYPDDRVAPTERDAEEARQLASQIVQFVRDRLPKMGR